MTLDPQQLRSRLLDHRGLDLDAARRVTYVIEQSFLTTTTRRCGRSGSGWSSCPRPGTAASTGGPASSR